MNLIDTVALALSAKGPKAERITLAELAVEGAYSPLRGPQDAFEAWLVEKWLRQIRSPEFRQSVQGQQLIAEWERGDAGDSGKRRAIRPDGRSAAKR